MSQDRDTVNDEPRDIYIKLSSAELKVMCSALHFAKEYSRTHTGRAGLTAESKKQVTLRILSSCFNEVSERKELQPPIIGLLKERRTKTKTEGQRVTRKRRASKKPKSVARDLSDLTQIVPHSNITPTTTAAKRSSGK